MSEKDFSFLTDKILGQEYVRPLILKRVEDRVNMKLKNVFLNPQDVVRFERMHSKVGSRHPRTLWRSVLSDGTVTKWRGRKLFIVPSAPASVRLASQSIPVVNVKP